ncbi:tRNA-(ms[2]io[6]A)-hydroxylase [Lyngbya confervoides]|uniref:tRNA-(Ms[2]io[6]A)-hydroxylase n=1 Tax=Lyngbya confervoides BDU141951 TaxID=1574623 RepID=A0ABD4T6J2_9CYAN|nr:tRNA-(ms[2]io[6]A)-hydroxylase [Lyngbya confervoides]MCM1984324.1 tRNA-(ms[2]io[6]A)-hydroxylase [Lyngbya confervoides BDU141951]
MEIQLKQASSPAWIEAVLTQFDQFLLDHAANEKKAAGVALNLAAHYPDKPDLVAAMIDLSIEELSHYRDVYKLIRERNIAPIPDQKDVYVHQIRDLIRKGSENYFLDRLLTAAVIEARGQERFRAIAQALPQGALKGFYSAIYKSEARHALMFVRFACQYYDRQQVSDRLAEFIDQEAILLRQLEIRPALH